MRLQRAILILTLGLLPVCSSAFGQNRVATVDEILTAAANAIGSPRDIQKVRSILAVADCVGPKGKYTTSISSFRDNKTRFEQTYTYRKPSSIFINGELVWEKNLDTGEHVVSDPFQRMVSRLHEYQKMAFDLRSFFTELEVAGDEEFTGRPSIMLKAKNELGMSAFLYFDKVNKRLNGYKLLIPNSTDTITNIFVEWKKVGRVTLPTVIKAIDSSGEWTLSFHTIKLNVADPTPLEIPPRIADMAELLRMHEEQKTAHLTYNAELMVGDSPKRPITVQRGNVTKRTRAEDLARFKAYFGSFKFLEWEDIAPPVIRISKDGTMATKIVQKRVRGISKDKDGKEVTEHVVYAWLEVLEKIDGKWRLVTIASTEKDGNN